MTGIAGILRFDQAPAGREEIEKVTAAVGAGVAETWCDGSIALGICRRHDEAESLTRTSPCMVRRSGLAIVFEGRLDNREELFSTLRPSRPLVDFSDAALVVEAYERWSEGCPEHMMGSFAFAIWDERKKRLFCARDPVGSCAFVFFRDDRTFAFASLPEALLELPGVSGAPNEHLIAHYLVPSFRNYADRRTWHKEVETLLPGKSMSAFADGRLRFRRYWEFGNHSIRQYRDFGECKEHFLHVFGHAVNDRMRGQKNPGVMMSGGLDTVAVAVMMKRLAAKAGVDKLHAYSAVLDEPENDMESRSILSLAGAVDAQLHRLNVPSMHGLVAIDDLKKQAWGRAHPVDNWVLLPAMMYLMASRVGQRALMHGACGDIALIAPKFYPSVLLRKLQIFKAWGECAAASKNHYILKRYSPLSIFLRSTAQAVAPRIFANLSWRKFKSGPCPIQNSLVNPEFARNIHLRDRLERERFSVLQPNQQQRERSQQNKHFALITSALSASGRLARRFGLEQEDPWSDLRVLDFCFRAPIECKTRDGWAKYLVRSAFAHEVDSETLWRTDKSHLGWMINRKLMLESRDVVSNVLESELEHVRLYVKVEKVEELFRKFLGSDGGDAWELVFGLTSLALWISRTKAL